MKTNKIHLFNTLRLTVALSFCFSIVSCGGSGGSQTAPTPTPITPPVITPSAPELITLDTLNAGMCADVVEETNGVEFMKVMSCSQSHQYEVAGSYDMDGFGDEFPGSIAIARRVHKDCRPLFESHTGQAYTGKGLGIETITPSISTWQSGDRSVICLVVNADRSPLTESVAL
jgi:hypothetical protein